MSGGRWGYQQYKMLEQAEFAIDAVAMLAEVEHILDYGYCADTCLECAKERTILIITAYFDQHFLHEGATWKETVIARHECTHR